MYTHTLLAYTFFRTVNYFVAEAIIIVDTDDQTEIQRVLAESCSVKLHLDFVTVSNNDEGTADVLREIRDKIQVYIK